MTDDRQTNSDSGANPTRILEVTPPTGLPLPRMIGGYEVIESIGEGGMGIVLRCRDKELQREVAIKLVRKELLGSADFVRRFTREARLSAALNHPNVVTTHQVGKHEGAPYLVLEFVDGKTLRDLLRTPPPLTVERILAIFAQCCDGLEAAARKGIVHRDVKPANIMVRGDDLVKVMDFGLSKQLDSESLTISNAVMGTPDYIAPEQAAGKPIDFRADIYSLGIALFQCLAGYIPFKSSSVWETISRHASEPLPDDSKVKELAGGDIWDLIDRMTAKTPEERPGSYRDIKEELLAIRARLTGEEASSAPSIPQEVYGDTIPLRKREGSGSRGSGSASRKRSSSAVRRTKRRMRSVGLVLGAALVVGALAAGIVTLVGGLAVWTGEAAEEPPPTLPIASAPARDSTPEQTPTLTMRTDRGAQVEDVLRSIGSFGVNYRLGENVTTRQVEVACHFTDADPRNAFDALSLAAGWDVSDSGGLLEIAQRPGHPGTLVAEHRATLEDTSWPSVSISTRSNSHALREACEAFHSSGEVDYLILTNLSERRLPAVSLTKFPLDQTLRLLNEGDEKFEWSLVGDILVIVPSPR